MAKSKKGDWQSWTKTQSSKISFKLHMHIRRKTLDLGIPETKLIRHLENRDIKLQNRKMKIYLTEYIKTESVILETKCTSLARNNLKNFDSFKVVIDIDEK